MAQETTEQAATRRRWISLAESVAVAGVMMTALSLYFSWSDRRMVAAARAHAERLAARATLVATVENDGRRLAVSNLQRPIATITVVFPAPLGIAPQADVTPAVIDAEWLAKPMLKLTDGAADKQRGKLPVLITASWADDATADAPRISTAIYDLSWRTEGHLLGGRTLRLQGLLLHQRGGNQALVDAIWRKTAPSPSGNQTPQR